MLYLRVCAERKRLRDLIHKIDKKLEDLPPGKMYITRNGKNFKWYCRLEEAANPVYIPKKKRKLAEQYAQKKYLLQLKKDLMHEITALDFYIRHHEKRPWKSEAFLTDKPEYQELLLSYFKPKSQELAEWANESYICNTSFPEHSIQKLPNGRRVRSKSEVMIATILDKYHIPYRVECKLEVGNKVYFPDFTIRHPQTGEIYYFEHLGLIEKPGYFENNVEKLWNYISHGIIPTVNLILTFETLEHPLTMERIEWLVKEYFL